MDTGFDFTLFGVASLSCLRGEYIGLCKELYSQHAKTGKGSQRPKNVAHMHDTLDHEHFSRSGLSYDDDVWDNRRRFSANT